VQTWPARRIVWSHKKSAWNRTEGTWHGRQRGLPKWRRSWKFLQEDTRFLSSFSWILSL